jgi:penicillin-binding protein 2
MVIKYRFRLYLFTLLLLAGFGALTQRLWNLTVERHEEFKNKVPGTKILKARIPGVRGEIKDRHGIPLAKNKQSFEVKLNLKTLVDEYKRDAKAKKKPVPKTEFHYVEKGLNRTREELDIVAIVNESIVQNLPPDLAAEFNAEKDLRVHYRATRGVVPWVYRQDLTFEQFSQFAERRIGLPGISVEERPIRLYPYQSLACHVLGYVALADINKVSDEERKQWSFFVPDDYGVTGVEKSFNAELQGRPGFKTVLQDEKGHIVKQLDYQEPRKGNDVYLTLDARIQYIAERALRESHPAIGRGAVVVLQPATGEVLAMASVPSYNPNKFIPKISREDFQDYLDNQAIPLMNRAVRGFTPGSTYKVMVSFAGILAGTQKDYWNCPGGITYGNKYMHCWIGQKGGSHGTLDLSNGLKNSCNCYFYQYGNHAGIGMIEKAGKMFGMGIHTGIELQEEDTGILPSPQWLRTSQPKAPAWPKGNNAQTANVSIGQGYVLATPLQMAGVAATVGNGGVPYRPHLLKKVMDGKDLVKQVQPEPRASFAENGLTDDKLELVRKGMWKVVNEEGGTAKAARIPGVEVAGKTGTAEAWRPDEKNSKITVKDNHTLFIAFAPYKDPKFAVCILVQGGKSGGGCAAPIARRVLEQALSLDQGNNITVAVAPTGEVKGHFNHIEQVSFEGIPPVTIESEETVVDSDDNTPPEKQEEIITPKAIPATSIREKADEEGSKSLKNQKTQPPPRRPETFKAPAQQEPPAANKRHIFGQ